MKHQRKKNTSTAKNYQSNGRRNGADRRVSNTRPKMKLWQKILILGVSALILIGSVVWIFVKDDSKIPTFAMQLAAPVGTQFSDDQAINFITRDQGDSSQGTVQVSLPEPNNNRNISDISNLHIYYNLASGSYAPVFKMDLNDAALESNIKITPFIKGKWTRAGSDGVLFTPARDWPADQKFTVTLNKRLFNQDIRIDDSRMSFTTPKLIGKIDSFNVYPDLSKKKSMIAVAVISFNYPIDAKIFSDKITLKLDGSKIDFSVKFDSFYRTAFITSNPVSVKDTTQKMRLNISGVDSLSGTAKSNALDANLMIESEDNFFKITALSTSVVDNQKGNPEQLVILNLTSPAKSVNWSDYIDVYLLPVHPKSDADKPYAWKPDEVTNAVLKDSQKLKIKPVDFVNPAGVYQYAFAYDVSSIQARDIYVNVKPGLMSDIGFSLKNGINKIMQVPYPERSVQIAGSGALLSLAGGKELGIVARGGAEAAYVNLYKVKSSEINHLITQSYNVFSMIRFKSYFFGPDDMSVVFQKKISFADTSLKKVNYGSVDLGDYLNRTGNDHTGIFIVQVGASQNEADYNDRKLILLTDLGIIRKVNADGSSALFVVRLSNGTPVGGAGVSILGRNGTPVWTGETDQNGRANAPKLSWQEYRNEKEPVVFVVRQGNDVSFIPYSDDYEQKVEYSKFDIDGVWESPTTPMNAYLFSDRGIYRPGEKFIIGGIVKEKTFKSLTGIPVKIEIRDARDKIIVEKIFSLGADGLFDIDSRLSDAAPVGDYSVRLYSLNDKNKTEDMLGMTSIRVDEFVADTLKINVSLNATKTKGWVKSTDLMADVSLRNLFGTPAQDRRIASRGVLTPVQFSFPEYKDYQFTPNFISGNGLARGSSAVAAAVHQTFPDVTTDKNGNAVIDIQFKNAINSGTYVLSFTAEGFEGNSGKSVQAATAAKISDADYLVGVKTSADLGYVNKRAKRSIHLISINSDAEKITTENLTIRVVKKEMLTSLIKDYNDYYKYQTVTREKILKTDIITIPQKGITLDLDTSTSGTYYVQVLNTDNKILANVDYFVAGAENLDLTVDQQAELKIKLNKSDYAPGSEIEVSITSPYIGSGLITIEKDKVYAAHWFKTNATSSVQRIRLPENFEGTGYVNVSFVRNINSRDIFTTPYTYAVAPFSADTSKRAIKIDLTAPDIIRDRKLTIGYDTNKSARMMIFAVNEGILQVAKYQTPKPLAHFFKKSALGVGTFQILSLLLPEYKILREFAKTGGGDYDDMADMDAIKQNITNPFARRTDAPVAFYSGIINTTANVPGTVTFDIPDSFNGAVRIYAVAANASAMGSASTDTRIQSPVIITSSAPLMAVPGDTFNVNAVISNLTENSGPNATVKATVSTSNNLTVTSSKDATLTIPEKSEALWTFDVTTGDTLGNATLDITANVLGDNGKTLAQGTSKSTLSIRPAHLFETNVRTAFETNRSITIKDFQIDMYKEHSSKTLFISGNSFVLAKPLFDYLKAYAYPCSEQIVSKALPYALFPNNSFLKTNTGIASLKITEAINTLKNRQNDDGSFALWQGGTTSRDNEVNASTAYVTTYVVQFLTIAKENGFNVPAPMLSRAIDYLRIYAGQNIQNNFDADTKAFAIYMITRNGFVTTSFIDSFEEYANKNMKNWSSELAGAYIAAAYKILKQDDKANQLIGKYKLSDSKEFTYFYDFSNSVTNDATYMYLVNTYFDGDISKDKVKQVIGSVENYIASGNYSSFTSAISLMALSGTDNNSDTPIDSISVIATTDMGPIHLQSSDASLNKAFQSDVPNNATKLEIKCADCNRDRGIFYTLIQQGFPKTTIPKSNGIEVTRAYYNVRDDKITSATVGDEMTVKIFARVTGNVDRADNIVIADLLPAGFSVVPDSITGPTDFVEAREDRVLIYMNLSRTTSEITYRVKATTAGSFHIPALTATSMYNPQIMGSEKSGIFTVANATVD